MTIDLISLRGQKCTSFDELFQLTEFKIKKTIIISAYTDIEALKVLVTKVLEHASKKSSELKIYLDKSASCYSTSEQVQEGLHLLHELITENFTRDSGIYLVNYGKLFHSKAYLFEGKNKGKFYIGSMNLTCAGLRQNEELLTTGQYNIGSKEKNTVFSEYLIEYATHLHSKSEYLSHDIPTKRKYTNFREIMLDGVLYSEYKESPFFSIPLKLPKEFREIVTDITYYGAERNNSISLEKIICNLFKLKKTNGTSSKALWKRYCIETSYGYWAHYSLIDTINEELNKKNSKILHFKKIRTLLLNENNKQKIKTVFADIINKLQAKIEEEGYTWEKPVTIETIENWLEKANENLAKDNFIKKLAKNVTYAPCPDFWQQTVTASALEESFAEFIAFSHAKSQVKNEIINQVCARIVLSEKDAERTIIKKIELWHTQNEGCIFSLDKG